MIYTCVFHKVWYIKPTQKQTFFRNTVVNNQDLKQTPSQQPIPQEQPSIIPAYKIPQDTVDHSTLHLSRRSIQRKAMMFGLLTGISRLLGILRESLLLRFLGLGVMSDAFIAAFRIPNLFRHVFAEGATNASFVPVIVKTVKEEGRAVASGLITIALLMFQGVILLMYLGILINTNAIVTFISPGFSYEQITYTATFLRILFPFLFLASGSALLSGALNSVNHFLVPAAGPVMFNIIYVASLIICIIFNFSTHLLCWGVLLGGLVQLLAHLAVYFKYQFTLHRIPPQSWRSFKEVMAKFFPFLLGSSIIELNLLVGGQVASFLPKGSVSILYYGSRFMNLPIGMLGVAFASVLLPHFSRIVLYAPKRISFYMLETSKFISLLVIPVALFLMLISPQLYINMIGSKASSEIVSQAALVLVIYCVGLLFFCLNKSLLNIFYSLKDTRSATMISVTGAAVNIIGDLIGMFFWGIYGIAAACSLSGIVMTMLCLWLLRNKHGYHFYAGNYGIFIARYAAQLMIIGGFFLSLFMIIMNNSTAYIGVHGVWHSLFYWAIALGCGAGTAITIWLTRRLFKLNVYFLR